MEPGGQCPSGAGRHGGGGGAAPGGADPLRPRAGHPGEGQRLSGRRPGPAPGPVSHEGHGPGRGAGAPGAGGGGTHRGLRRLRRGRHHLHLPAHRLPPPGVGDR
ncbi:MAG: hypothetical protein ACLRWQ_18225 [Flavonifractor plautii]